MAPLQKHAADTPGLGRSRERKPPQQGQKLSPTDERLNIYTYVNLENFLMVEMKDRKGYEMRAEKEVGLVGP